MSIGIELEGKVRKEKRRNVGLYYNLVMITIITLGLLTQDRYTDRDTHTHTDYTMHGYILNFKQI